MIPDRHIHTLGAARGIGLRLQDDVPGEAAAAPLLLCNSSVGGQGDRLRVELQAVWVGVELHGWLDSFGNACENRPP
eukprot:103365-Prymnesium_polylepis.2